jgi:ubiquinone/menaquinone biosynthesis C-methylase UbiE
VKSKELYPAVFSRHAVDYARRLDGIMANGEARGRVRALELAGARPGMRMLDLACGPGTLTRLLASQVAPDGEVVGIDLAEGMLELARRSAPPNARFELMDMEQLAFADGSFDGAVCGHGLQFAPNLGQALREARRVLRPGGVLAASIPAAAMKEDVWSLIDSVVDRWLPPRPVVVDEQATRAAVRDGALLEEAARGAGFATARVESVDEEVVWQSAEQLVSTFMGWWDFAYRIEGLDASRREAFEGEALQAVRQSHPGAITTHGRTLVLVASK